ncbi:TetR/AcrR family transcriptional regulator [Microbacterium marinilacus]|uniref:HTH tetR-type domain-containing protein n=1 Tax=Microbacterium marinilacus TaxID=415209 RepID=A0ABP7BLM4_9MICO|nr:TetR/AcrR family transcriptional regulator [Microbacterium marinilacus]MBY0690441.1 TetR/AcrR family transcriptional regulator [Microbacterium marinilacus]
MDVRFLRSRDSLRAAVLDLTTETPIADVTASAVCQRAGVTRDTFYRHAESPLDLLAEALADEIAEVMDGLPGQRTIGDGERALIEHVHRRSAVYRNTMHPLLAGPVRANLDRMIRRGLQTWAGLHPRILPPAFADDPQALELAVAYAAGGTVGAIEEWLRRGDDDIDRAVRLILAASPEWWLR